MTKLNWLQRLVAEDTVNNILYDTNRALNQKINEQTSNIATLLEEKKTLMEIRDKAEGLLDEVIRLRKVVNEYESTKD